MDTVAVDKCLQGRLGRQKEKMLGRLKSELAALQNQEFMLSPEHTAWTKLFPKLDYI